MDEDAAADSVHQGDDDDEFSYDEDYDIKALVDSGQIVAPKAFADMSPALMERIVAMIPPMPTMKELGLTASMSSLLDNVVPQLNPT